MFKKIISLLLVIAILFAFSCPAFADNTSSVVTKWDRLLYGICRDADQSASASQLPIIKWLLSFSADIVGEAASSLDSNLCPNSDDHFHHGHISEPIHTLDDKAILCTCDLCGQNFWCYSEDLKQYYFDSVENGIKESLLPAQTVNSDGKLLWSPTLYELEICINRNFDYLSSRSASNPYAINVSWDVSNLSFSASSLNVSGTTVLQNCLAYFSDTYPMSGYYELLSDTSYSIKIFDADGNSTLYTDSFPSESASYHAYNFSYSYTNRLVQYASFSVLSAQFYAPVYRITPDTALDITSGDTYNIDNRIGQYIQDFTYNGQTYNEQIVNETTNQYYSPTNNEYFDMNGWSYDYSTQTYNITNNNGDTVTVTYGDEYITINEGDTIYNYYYYITNEAPDDPDNPGTSGLIEWFESFKTWLGEKLDNIGGNVTNVTQIVGDPNADDTDGSGFLLDLVKTLFKGVVKITTHAVSIVVDGIDGLASQIDGFGDMFGLFNPENHNGVYYVAESPPGGVSNGNT